jgi:hypothetical protein
LPCGAIGNNASEVKRHAIAIVPQSRVQPFGCHGFADSHFSSSTISAVESWFIPFPLARVSRQGAVAQD